ncbi:MAG: FAD-dependent monooxygenase [Burkholderiaceae bacterium]|nr:FAD-dependent monooxygenase [Burkholderiaceae bacterium]
MTNAAPALKHDLDLAVIGAGPAGLALALHAARALPKATVTIYDARAEDVDIARDPRTIALSLGSVQLLQRLEAWNSERAQAILEVHVSQQPPSWGPFGEPELRIRASDESVPMLGAVLSYGEIVAPLQAAWLAAAAHEPQRLRSRFGTPVSALKNLDAGVEVDAGIAERFDLAVVAEGGVFSDQARKAIAHDYKQTAWVGRVTIEGGAPGTAYERFTRQGPAALLPLKGDGAKGPRHSAALVWCVNADDDPVRDLDDAQRLTVLASIFHPCVGRLTGVSPLKHFALGLNAERTLVDGRTVRIGNAAQTLHPVAGQGLSLGLRDAFELVRALAADAGVGAGVGARVGDIDAVLRHLEWQRAPDRWGMIAATDFLARSFTWQLPGLGAARGLGLASLQALAPLKSAIARQMMFGSR